MKPDRNSQSDETASASQNLIRRLGQRVRSARERMGISRRELSERSGVSARYLAQLEVGEGNISIVLLHRISTALGQKTEAFLVENGPTESEEVDIAALYRSASQETRRTVRQLLEGDRSETSREHRICLVGLRGAGKSTLGALLGKALDLPFVELNQTIEEQSGMPVEEVIALYGQEGYRNLEAQAVMRVIDTHRAVVLAVSGGVVLDPDTYGGILKAFHTVWLKTSPNEHMMRVRAQGDERPMAGNPEAMEQLKSILTSREALYRKANAHLDTSGTDVATSSTQLLDLIRARGFLV